MDKRSIEQIVDDYNVWPINFIKIEALKIFRETANVQMKLQALQIIADVEDNRQPYPLESKLPCD